MRIHPRSGLAWSKGITLANCEGIVDEDYSGEVKIALVNHGSQSVHIQAGERIAQAEFVKLEPHVIFVDLESGVRTHSSAHLNPSRLSGGFGSTGQT
jgi:dUTP pyrophosphatase